MKLDSYILIMIMKCEECGKETDGTVCKECGLIIDDRPIAKNNDSYPSRREDITTLYSADNMIWEHPLASKARKISKAFKPKYQKEYIDYVYIKAYEVISKFCAQLKIPIHVRYEALNIFKDIQKKDQNFFKSYKLGPTYLACIKIACMINDFPISSHELASVIDYHSNISNTKVSYMERRFNRAYRAILKLFKLKIKRPERPNFIAFACNKLGLPHSFIVEIYKQYALLKRYFQPHFRVEGYILALIYIFGNERFKFYLRTLEKIFHTSSKTIVSRRDEILKYASKEM